MTIFIEPSTSNRPRTRSQKDSSFLGVVAEMNPEALTKKGRAEVKKTQIKTVSYTHLTLPTILLV